MLRRGCLGGATGFQLTYNVFHVEALTPFDGARPLPLSGNYQHGPHSFMQHMSHKGGTSRNPAGLAPPAAHIMLPCLLVCFSMTLWAVQSPEESNRGLPTTCIGDKSRDCNHDCGLARACQACFSPTGHKRLVCCVKIAAELPEGLADACPLRLHVPSHPCCQAPRQACYLLLLAHSHVEGGVLHMSKVMSGLAHSRNASHASDMPLVVGALAGSHGLADSDLSRIWCAYLLTMLTRSM